ncbi:MAG: uroporphyrinogen decarboxylase family protein [Rectinemataceae bacterium]
MTDTQWDLLRSAAGGRGLTPGSPAAAFIIDSPWLPGWAGISILDYFAHEEPWFEANREAVEAFPDAIFLPGFWAEYGMCTEPSAFGARCSFGEKDFPFAHPVMTSIDEVDRLPDPDPASDGLLPFVLKRLEWALPRMEAIGHRPRFSVSRGPLNVASFLLGTTEFLVALRTEPERSHALLRKVTDFLLRWHRLQKERFPSIDGIMALDDIVGFLGEEDFLEFGLPYLSELFALKASVKLFHNDADCLSSAKYYPRAGINLYNPGIQRSIADILDWTEGRLTVMGSIPPRDVLAAGSPADVALAVRTQTAANAGRGGLIPSCAGGMPPGVATPNIRSFLDALAAGEASKGRPK